MRLEPQVSALKDDLEGEAVMLRVSIHSEVGQTLRERYDFDYTPLFIVFDTQGQESWRGGEIPSQEVIFRHKR